MGNSMYKDQLQAMAAELAKSVKTEKNNKRPLLRPVAPEVYKLAAT